MQLLKLIVEITTFVIITIFIIFQYPSHLLPHYLLHLPVHLEVTLNVACQARVTDAQSLMLVGHVTVIKDVMNVVNAAPT